MDIFVFKNVRFIKIAISFPFLIPCLILPREHRPTTERTPIEHLMDKKALFLRLSPKKVDLISEKVDSVPKKFDSFSKKVDLSVYQQNHPITLKLLKLLKLFPLKICTIANFVVPLHREPAPRGV